MKLEVGMYARLQNDTYWLKELKEDMIYSIVTHEQMEQMAYKVEE